MHIDHTPNSRPAHTRNIPVSNDFDDEFLRKIVGEPKEDVSLWRALGLDPHSFELEVVS